MALRPSNKRNPNFNMSSLTDIIFLLLIFFMLTSNFVTPNGVDLVLPSSNSQALVATEPISVSINNEEVYKINDEEVAFEQLEPQLQTLISTLEAPTIVLYMDKSIAVEKAIEVMNVAKNLQVKMILATTPLEDE